MSNYTRKTSEVSVNAPLLNSKNTTGTQNEETPGSLKDKEVCCSHCGRGHNNKTSPFNATNQLVKQLNSQQTERKRNKLTDLEKCVRWKEYSVKMFKVENGDTEEIKKQVFEKAKKFFAAEKYQANKGLLLYYLNNLHGAVAGRSKNFEKCFPLFILYALENQVKSEESLRNEILELCKEVLESVKKRENLLRPRSTAFLGRLTSLLKYEFKATDIYKFSNKEYFVQKRSALKWFFAIIDSFTFLVGQTATLLPALSKTPGSGDTATFLQAFGFPLLIAEHIFFYILDLTLIMGGMEGLQRDDHTLRLKVSLMHFANVAIIFGALAIESFVLNAVLN